MDGIEIYSSVDISDARRWTAAGEGFGSVLAAKRIDQGVDSYVERAIG